MAAGSRECRQYAWRCAELAQSARTPELKALLLELSKNWVKLAIQMENNIAIRDMDDPPPIVPFKRA
jgi:hypothetical protein